MTESRVPYLTKVVAQNDKKCDTIIVNRADLEKEHGLLMARLHMVRHQLGYPPLTLKEQRRLATK
jgi:ribosome biogenesis GTPase A